MSAVSLQEMLGLGSYRTAWAWLHKLRRVMVRPDRDRLSGSVEVDETYLGGLEEGLCGRQVCSKALIVVAAEEAGKATGRIRMRRIDSASGKELHGFVTGAIEKGSVLHTDGWSGYRGLDQKGYVHEVTPLRGRKHAATELLPRVHRAISLLKRWLLGTHHGAVSHKHLDYYLDEFTFRFNRRTSRQRGKLFFRLVQQAVVGEPRTYRSLIGNQGKEKLKTVTTTYCGHLTKVHTPNILFAAGLLYAGNFSVSDVALRRNFSSMGMFVMVALMTRMKMLVIPMFSVMLMLMIRFSLVIVTVRVLMGMIVRVRM